MTTTRNKYATIFILLVSLFLANVSGILAAPIDASLFEEDATVREQQAESSGTSTGSEFRGNSTRSGSIPFEVDFEEIAELIAEALGISVEELALALRESPNGLRELGLNPMVFRMAIRAATSENIVPREALLADGQKGIAGMMANPHGKTEEVFAFVAIQGPEALQEQGLNPQTRRRVLMFTEMRAKSEEMSPTTLEKQPVNARTGVRISESGQASRESYSERMRHQDDISNRDRRETLLRQKPQSAESQDLLELTAQKLGIHPAELRAAFRDAAMELALESVGLNAMNSKYANKEFRGHGPRSAGWEAKESFDHDYNRRYGDAWQGRTSGGARENSDQGKALDSNGVEPKFQQYAYKRSRAHEYGDSSWTAKKGVDYGYEQQDKEAWKSQFSGLDKEDSDMEISSLCREHLVSYANRMQGNPAKENANYDERWGSVEMKTEGCWTEAK